MRTGDAFLMAFGLSLIIVGAAVGIVKCLAYWRIAFGG